MPDYDIVFDKGQTFELRNTACFSELSDLKGCLTYKFPEISKGMVITNDYRRIDRDTVSYIRYYPFANLSLSEKEVDTYISYLYYHRGWGKYFLNTDRSDILTRGAKVDATGYGEHLLALLQAIRYITEKPDIVRAFNRFISPSFRINPDMAFIVAHYIIFNPMSGDMNITGYWGHSVIDTSLLTDRSIVGYATVFPYEPISKVKYNDILDPRKVHSYMASGSKSGSKSTLSELFRKCIVGDKVSRVLLLKEIDQLQREVDEYNEKTKTKKG